MPRGRSTFPLVASTTQNYIYIYHVIVWEFEGDPNHLPTRAVGLLMLSPLPPSLPWGSRIQEEPCFVSSPVWY